MVVGMVEIAPAPVPFKVEPCSVTLSTLFKTASTPGRLPSWKPRYDE